MYLAGAARQGIRRWLLDASSLEAVKTLCQP
jgi:hypothetical protein